MKRSILIAIATIIVCCITLASGVIHGRLTNRWGAPPAMVSAAKKLDDVPKQFGDWEMLADKEMDETSINMLELENYVNRVYKNKSNDQKVHVAVLIGPAGRISVHTPEVCFNTRTYKQQKKRERTLIVEVDEDGKETGVTHNLWKLPFKSINKDDSLLGVYYGWNQDGTWTAYDDPRWDCAGSPYLYKIQLSAEVPPGKTMEDEDGDACKEFLKEFLRELKQHLVFP